MKEGKLSEELTNRSARSLAELIRVRAVSPVEVMEAHLLRIEKLNPRLNAIVTLAPSALAGAREAEARVMKGEPLGLLHGLPVTVKDTIETAGLRTTSGSRVRASYVPERDAQAVARLKAAGAIILGKTNVSELAMTYEALNPVFGGTLNPYDEARTAGGSSGGEASAISACLSPAGLGSDLMGSIRIPAHFCGITGLKPTTGRVQSAGHFPPATGPHSLGAAFGPMARRVEDLTLLLNVIGGMNPLEAASVPLQSTDDAGRINLRGQRVAWYTNDGTSPVTESTRLAVLRAAGALEAAGLVVEEEMPPGIERGPQLWSALFSKAMLGQLRTMHAGREEEAGEFVRYFIETMARGPAPSFEEFAAAWVERDVERARLVEWMARTPLVVAPVYATQAFEQGARKVEVNGRLISIFKAGSYSQTFNVYGLPSVSVPTGRTTPDGLPVGVQIVGRPFDEERVLAAALIIEEALGGWQPPQASAPSPESRNPL